MNLMKVEEEVVGEQRYPWESGLIRVAWLDPVGLASREAEWGKRLEPVWFTSFRSGEVRRRGSRRMEVPLGEQAPQGGLA